MSLNERWRQEAHDAANRGFEDRHPAKQPVDCDRSMLAADAAVRVVLEHLRDEFSRGAVAGEAGADYGHALSREDEAYNEALQVAWTVVSNLLKEATDA